MAQKIRTTEAWGSFEIRICGGHKVINIRAMYPKLQHALPSASMYDAGAHEEKKISINMQKEE